MNKFELTTRNHYHIRGCHAGRGEKHLVAFHGFGQSAEVLCAQLSFLKDDRNIWCFNLPFHGGDNGFESKKDYLDGITAFLTEKGIGQYDVFGFSIGARVAMELVVRSGQKLYLLAPDGVARRWPFECLTRSIAGKAVFKFVTYSSIGASFFSVVLGGVQFLMPGIPLRKLWLSAKWRHQLYDRWVALSCFSRQRRQVVRVLDTYLYWLLIAEKDVLIDNRRLVKLCKQYGWKHAVAPVHHDVISIQLSLFVSAKSLDLRITSSSAQEASE